MDKIRIGLGLKPLNKARKEGNDLLDRVVAQANTIATKAFENQQERKSKYEEMLDKDMKEDKAQ